MPAELLLQAWHHSARMAKRKQEEVAKDMESVKVSHTETDPAPKASPEKTKDLAAVSSSRSFGRVYEIVTKSV